MEAGCHFEHVVILPDTDFPPLSPWTSLDSGGGHGRRGFPLPHRDSSGSGAVPRYSAVCRRGMEAAARTPRVDRATGSRGEPRVVNDDVVDDVPDVADLLHGQRAVTRDEGAQEIGAISNRLVKQGHAGW